MRIFLCSSRSGYAHVGPIQEELERRGHAVTPPNNYDDPGCEERIKAEGKESYLDWKAEMIVRQTEKVRANDAILVLNFEKEGQPNYLGGATFLEVFKAWELGKKIFFHNALPTGMLHDELAAMRPTVIEGDLDRIV